MSESRRPFRACRHTCRNATRRAADEKAARYRLYGALAALLLSRKHQPLPLGIMAAISYALAKGSHELSEGAATRRPTAIANFTFG